MKNSINSKDSQKLCSLLRSAREQAGYSQQRLAEMLGKPQSFVAKYELGERRIDVLEFIEIAKILNFEPSHMIKLIMKR